MNKYNTFLVVFIISFIAFIVLMGIYLNNIFSVIGTSELINTTDGPQSVLSAIFTSPFMISGFITLLSSIAYRVIGIVSVAKNKTVNDGEKALWIIGFVLMGFVTGIVFLVMARGRKFVE